VGKPETVYEIRNGSGDYVCSRGTISECRQLLEKFVTPKYPMWCRGPYSVHKVIRERKFTFKSRQLAGDTPSRTIDSDPCR